MSNMASNQVGAANMDSGTSSNKRKHSENGQSQQRSKRNRYISIACNECKRRKIKCNGETPCQRCGNLNLECLYAPNCCSGHNFRESNEFKQMDAQIRFLQDQVNSLISNITSLRQTLGQNEYDAGMFQFNRDDDTTPPLAAPQASMVVDPALQRAERPSTQQGRFQGPTSSAFSLDVAKNSLEHLGITAGGDAIDDSLVNHGQTGNSTDRPIVNTSKDPIWCLDKEEALRLCSVYEDEIGLMYPVLDIKYVSNYASLLYTFVDAVQRNLSVREREGADAIEDEDTDILKTVLAIALVTEGTGHNELATRLFANVSKSAEGRFLGSVGLKDIQLLALMAIYHFHSDDEGLSWRIIGLTARLSIEVGLHRAETYDRMFPDLEEREQAIKTFWSVYVLDRRWSLGTGMSFAIQETDLDRALPLPSEENIYFNAMIKYSHISTKVWKSILGAGSDSSEKSKPVPDQDEVTYLDYQVRQWQEEIPESLQYIQSNSAEFPHHPPDLNEAGGRGLYRLRVLLYLRANQMRILIYRPVLHSAASILKRTRFADTVIDVAKDSIRVLRHVNQSSSIYRTQQMCFNYFLLSAMAVLFLAVSHAPAKYADSCRDEWHTGVDLVRGLSATSYVSRRLWRTIRGLKEIGLKIGLAREAQAGGFSLFKSLTLAGSSKTRNSLQTRSKPQTQDAQRSAAMAMADLAGHHVDESLYFATSHTHDGEESITVGSSTGFSTCDNNSTHLSTPSKLLSTQQGQLSSPEQGANTSPNRMALELTGLFEAAGEWSNSSDTNAINNGLTLSPSPNTNHNDHGGGGASANMFALPMSGMNCISQRQPNSSNARSNSNSNGSGNNNNSVATMTAGISGGEANQSQNFFDGDVSGSSGGGNGMYTTGMSWGFEDALAKVMRECF